MTTDAFVRHYTAVADRSAVPVLLYNVTMYTGVNLLPDAVGILSRHPNIVGIKETNSDMVQFGEYLARAEEGFTVLAVVAGLEADVIGAGFVAGPGVADDEVAHGVLAAELGAKVPSGRCSSSVCSRATKPPR